MKTVTQRWPDGSGLSPGSEDGGPSRINDAFVIPTMG
jgi:malonate-semialdehyde dehydrogenase (acetylating)/methylmalonate-semialdehyde dehydrogenase